MARKIIHDLVDDLDGDQAAETITFALDGVTYEIDLSEENAAELRNQLAPYMRAGRKQRGQKTTRRRSSDYLHTVRDWARANGYDVSPRGRIPTHILDAYANRNKHTPTISGDSDPVVATTSGGYW